ncbi:MAG TPA: hypothetical protein VGL61_09700 [Kofleriaceae bacterium]|jgi:hypothetical protein
MLRAAVVVSIFAACTSTPSESFDGPPERFVVDSVTVPTVDGQAAGFGYDFNGDGQPDNAFGDLTTTLASEGDITSDVADLVGDGVLTSTIEIMRGDQGDGVQITWDSLATWTASLTNTGAITTDGPMPMSISPRVPALIDADPTPIPLAEVAMQLIPDDAGGYVVQVQALADGTAFRDAAATSVVQMITSNPSAHRLLEGELGNMSDDAASVAGVEQAQLFQLLTTSDQANDQFSVGYRFHVTACAAGWCNGAPVIDHCEDRIVDADETGIDCGGSCHPCSGGLSCEVDADCDSQVCDAGACRFATCDDGVQDGFEYGVDCGDGCHECSAGEPCASGSDCASGLCERSGDVSSLGTCT